MPPRSLAVILNPAAANRRAGRELARLRDALEASGTRFALLTTERPGHATDLAREAASAFDAVVAAGGDGTLQEVATGLLGAPDAALGVIPLGTGNDFAQHLGLPKQTGAAVRALLDAEIVPVDGGRVRWRNAGEHAFAEAVFINAVGVGFDALVAAEAAKYKVFRGLSGYLAAVAKALRLWTHPDLEARRSVAFAPAGTEDDAEGETLYRGPFFLAAVSNGVSVGGGFRLTPEARYDDGLLDLCLVAGPLSTPRVFRLLPKAILGRHLGEPEVTMDRLAGIGLRIASGVPIHVDGEILTRAAVEVEVEVLPGAFRMLRPRP